MLFQTRKAAVKTFFLILAVQGFNFKFIVTQVDNVSMSRHYLLYHLAFALGLTSCQIAKIEIKSLNSPLSLKLSLEGNVHTGRCSEVIHLRLVNQNGAPSSPRSVTSISLNATGIPSRYYLDSSCEGDTISGLSVPAHKTEALFYVKSNFPGSHYLTVSSPGLSSDTLSVRVDTSMDLIESIAGRPSFRGYRDDTGTSSRLDSVLAMTTDGNNLYFADPLSETVRKMDLATLEVSTIAGELYQSGNSDGPGTDARFRTIGGLATDGIYLYIADRNHRIRRMNLGTGAITHLAGSTTGQSGTTNATGSSARFNIPTALEIVGNDLYISDYANHRIRRMDLTTNAVTTVAGSSSGHVDATGTSARFDYPQGLAFHGGHLYIADSGNEVIRRIDLSNNAVSTIAGAPDVQGSNDGVGGAARFSGPFGIKTDGTYFYVSDIRNTAIRRLRIADWNVETIAGQSGDSETYVDGSFQDSRFYDPRSIALVGSDLYVSELTSRMRKLDLNNQVVTTVAGGQSVFAAGVDGTRAEATFSKVKGTVSDGTYIYIADSGSHTIRRYSIETGTVETIAGALDTPGSTDGNGLNARFNGPQGLALGEGSLFVTDYEGHTIRKIDLLNLNVTTLAGLAGNSGSTDGSGSTARFYYPAQLVYHEGNLYVSDYYNCTVRKIVLSTSLVSTFAGSAGNCTTATGIGSAARFYYPWAMTLVNGFIYIGTDDLVVQKIDLSSAEVIAVAGNGSFGISDGVGSGASLTYIYSMSTDGNKVYIGCSAGRVRVLETSSNSVSTLVGGPTINPFSDFDGNINSATSYLPESIVWTPSGIFFFDDGINLRWIH